MDAGNGKKRPALHGGYLGSQDTFYVGTLKGVGRIYQQTYIAQRPTSYGRQFRFTFNTSARTGYLVVKFLRCANVT